MARLGLHVKYDLGGSVDLSNRHILIDNFKASFNYHGKTFAGARTAYNYSHLSTIELPIIFEEIASINLDKDNKFSVSACIEECGILTFIIKSNEISDDFSIEEMKTKFNLLVSDFLDKSYLEFLTENKQLKGGLLEAKKDYLSENPLDESYSGTKLEKILVDFIHILEPKINKRTERYWFQNFRVIFCISKDRIQQYNLVKGLLDLSFIVKETTNKNIMEVEQLRSEGFESFDDMEVISGTWTFITSQPHMFFETPFFMFTHTLWFMAQINTFNMRKYLTKNNRLNLSNKSIAEIENSINSMQKIRMESSTSLINLDSLDLAVKKTQHFRFIQFVANSLRVPRQKEVIESMSELIDDYLLHANNHVERLNSVKLAQKGAWIQIALYLSAFAGIGQFGGMLYDANDSQKIGIDLSVRICAFLSILFVISLGLIGNLIKIYSSKKRA